MDTRKGWLTVGGTRSPYAVDLQPQEIYFSFFEMSMNSFVYTIQSYNNAQKKTTINLRER
jgi:hypothetical protein